jgi:CMP-N,N'-diacetyllegionaminic acid synthase
MNFLFIIPSRAGSKAIPDKNKKLLNGKPLIAYSIECALTVSDPMDICISTNDDDVIEIAKQYGIAPLFKRPEELSTDSASAFDVLKHAVSFYQNNGKIIDAIVLLQPTSPLRKEIHLKESLALYKSEIDMVVSVNIASTKLVFNENVLGFLELESSVFYEKRQDAKDKYNYNGAIYIINTNSLMHKNISEFDKIVKYQMDDISSMDIDTPLDWKIVEYLLIQN